MTLIKASYHRRTGFREDENKPGEDVTILGFVESEYAPGYQRSGTKRCVLAIIAHHDGRLSQAELQDLTYRGAL